MTTLIRMRRLALVVPAMACLLLCGRADGSIVFVDESPDIVIPADFDGVYITFGGTPAAPTLSSTTTDPGAGNWDFNLFYGGAALGNSDTFQPVTASTATNSDVLNLSNGDTVGGSSTFPSGFSGSTGHMSGLGGEFTSGTQGYIGFRLDASRLGGTPGDYHYGWLAVTLRDDGTAGSINWWAIESVANTSVTLIPEMSAPGLAAFLLFTAALMHRRRKRA